VRARTPSKQEKLQPSKPEVETSGFDGCNFYCMPIILLLFHCILTSSTITWLSSAHTHQARCILLLLLRYLYYSHPLSNSFLLTIRLLLSMSSVLSSLMHYISFTFKQSLTALLNACTPAFNFCLSLLLTSTYPHRWIRTYRCVGGLRLLYSCLRRCAHAHQASNYKEDANHQHIDTSMCWWFAYSL